MKEAKAKAMLESVNKDYAGLNLYTATDEVRGTWAVTIYGGPIGFGTRYLFGTEDRDDLEEEFPILKDWKLFTKDAEKWAKKLITNGESPTWHVVDVLQAAVNRQADTFKHDCPDCSFRRTGEKPNRIGESAERCYECNTEHRIEIGEVCAECRCELAAEGKEKRSWNCQGHETTLLAELLAANDELDKDEEFIV